MSVHPPFGRGGHSFIYKVSGLASLPYPCLTDWPMLEN